MARLESYVAQKGLDPGSTPSVQLDDAPWRALAQVGRSIQAAGEYAQARKEKAEDFRVENDYRRMNMELENELTNMEPPEDGVGFHDNFVANVYNPKREAFLASLPERHREKFAIILGDGDPNKGLGEGADRARWSISAANKEREATNGWFTREASLTQEQLRSTIALDPARYDEILDAGNSLWDSTGLPKNEIAKRKAEWEQMAQVSYLDTMLERDPEAVIKALGVDISSLTPTTKLEMLSRAVEGQETGGEANPDSAVSRAGALGRMQIMPGTAREIAGEIKDPNFNPAWDPAQVGQYLSNPATNRRYGQYYLSKMLKQYKGDVQAALIAYNGGPKRADAWLAANRDDSVIPDETRKYYKQVLQRLPGFTGPTGSADPSKVTLSGSTENVSPDLAKRVQTAFASVGIDNVKIKSGYRDPVKNEQVGGAEKSQHLHGNAFDIDVSGYSQAKRLDIIRALSASGIGGIGVYANTIHADVGSRRAWGPSYGSESVPKWAAAAIAEHLSSTAKAPSAGGRFSSVPYEQRRAYVAKADSAISGMLAAQKQGDALVKVQVQSEMNNELARIAATGSGSGAFDDTRVADALGTDDYVKWVARKQEAERMFMAKDGVISMTADQMAERLEDYKADPSSDTFASDQKVEASVLKEIERVQKLRANDPGQAALEFPDVKDAWAKLQAVEPGQQPDPGDVQALVKLMLDRQTQFNIAPDTKAPIPKAWALEIGRSLTRVPELKGSNAADVRASIAVQYNALKEYFGEYTEEVIIYALQEFKGVNPDMAKLLTGYMQAIEAGGDPLRLKPKQIEDMNAVEGLSWAQRARNWWMGDEADADVSVVPSPEAAENATALDAETRLRLQTRLRGATPEEEAGLVELYGQAAVDAVKQGMGESE